MALAANPAFCVEHEGRWWQWAELVRALDGYITVVDRGRHSRFWNFMAAWYQSALSAGAVVGAVIAEDGVGGAIGDDDDAAGMLAAAAAGAATIAAVVTQIQAGTIVGYAAGTDLPFLAHA